MLELFEKGIIFFKTSNNLPELDFSKASPPTPKTSGFSYPAEKSLVVLLNNTEGQLLTNLIPEELLLFKPIWRATLCLKGFSMPKHQDQSSGPVIYLIWKGSSLDRKFVYGKGRDTLGEVYPITGTGAIINCASNSYWHLVEEQKYDDPIITFIGKKE